MLHVPFIFCNIFQQLSNDVLLKLYKQMVTLTIVDDNLYKTQRMISEYVLLARVNGTELACSNKIVFTKPKRNPAWVLNSCMDILSICCDTRAPVAQFVRACDQNSGSNPGWISILFCNNSSTSSQLIWQGLISFYMKASGEEATHFGSAAALANTDMVYTQFRELGVLMWRGFTVDDVMDQCFSTKWEQGKGRQMPVHYGSKEHNFQTVSSCVGNQMPQGICTY